MYNLNKEVQIMIELKTNNLKKIRDVNPCLVSYNIEFAEVTGGTFWKEYTKDQISGKEPFKVSGDANDLQKAMGELMQVYPPVDLTNARVRKLAKALGQCWIRVSGTWATKTYYDFDGKTNGVPPFGYQNVLTKKQWLGVLDFVKAVNGKLMISLANCQGLHGANEPWNPSEAEKIFSLSKEYGVPIMAAEFANEPNMLQVTGFPQGYTAKDYRRDQDLFYAWVRENYPECKLVGPCNTAGTGDNKESGGGLEKVMGYTCSCEELMEGTKQPIDIYSYHCYNGCSERLAMLLPQGHWKASEATSEPYLSVISNACSSNIPYRDKYCPNGEMWVTEAGDAGGGGDTWASTYLDVIRNINEHAHFSKLTNGVIFHNTLCSSDYGYLHREDFIPRPNYFGVLLWNKLMGSEVYETNEEIRLGAHVFAHNRKDGKSGYAYVVINNDLENSSEVNLPENTECYILAPKDDIRSSIMTLNGNDLVLKENDELPSLDPVIKSGTYTLAPGNIAFFLTKE